MKKISFRNIFKKSEADKSSKGNRGLLILLLILLAGAIIYLGYPLLFPERVASTRVIPSTTTPRITVATSPVSSPPKTEEVVLPEKTPFDMEMEKRKQAYEEKIFVYEPYEPPSYRNPFQRVSTSYSEPEVATVEEGEAWWKQIAIYKPELPPKTKLNGIVGSEKNRIAMIEMDGKTFIAKLYDILLDKYIVKEIRRDQVILEVDDYEFSLKIGGEEASNE